MNKQTQDWRFAQANKEALFSLGAYALYFIWWFIFGYGMGDGDPEQYAYVFGMPEWFFYSCIVGYPVITILLWGIVRFFFKEMPLDDEVSDDELGTAESEQHDADSNEGNIA